MRNSSRLLGQVSRYIAAPLVAFVVSYVTAVFAIPFFVILFVALLHMRFAFNLAFAVPGFCGVFAGARCLPHIHRRFGSILLLLLGQVYFCGFVATWGGEMTDEGTIVNVNTLWLTRLDFLSVGGFIATILA